MYYKCHKVNLNVVDHILILQTEKKNQKAAINPKNEDDKSFQYAATVALNYEETEWNPEIVSNIKALINKSNWQKTNYSSKIDNWKTLGKHNPTIALDFVYLSYKLVYLFVIT